MKINHALNRIETRTYQKPMNLYLYIPQASAHPKETIKGMIFGELRRYKVQNTKREDYLDMVVHLLFLRIKARGWRPTLLKSLCMEAANRIESNVPRRNQKDDTVDPRERSFIHMEYHPNGISRQQIRQAFDETCGSFCGTRAAVDQITVAYSRPRNLRDELTSARFYPATNTAALANSPT